MKTLRIVLCLLFLFPSSTLAGGYANGYSEDGYTYQDGYWFSGGVPYTRTTEYYQQPYTAYSYGCCGSSYAYTAYRQAYRYVYTKAALPSYKDPDWRAKLLDIAAARDKVEGKMRLSAQEQQQFTEAVGVLGLQGNFYWQSYGRNPVVHYAGSGYGATGSYQLSGAGVQAQTVYGYSLSSVADVYGDLNLNTLFQQSARLTENAQQLAGQANGGFQALVDKAGNNKARVAEILAKGQAAGYALKASEASPSSHVQTQVQAQIPVNKATITQKVEAIKSAVSNQPAISQADFLRLSGPAQCVACHSGSTVQGGFDITRYNPSTTPPEDKRRVIAYIVSADPVKHCPKEGRLTPEQVLQFIYPNVMPNAE